MRGEEKRDSVVVSLITCWPGSEIYELCGHEAIRVRGYADGHALDSVWNYGVFDFSAPNFAYRYVKGETDYLLGAYPFDFFLPEYKDTGRKVLEQDLNLTDEEALRFLRMLREEALPQNRVYRYSYISNNCATRILDRLETLAGGRIVYPDTVRYGTYRREMRHYHKDYPWYQFGIDLALGSGLDVPVRGRDEMFVPMEMASKVEKGKLPDGRPLVRESRILNQGVENASLPPTPWYLTPLFCGSVWFLFCVGATILMARRKKVYRWLYCFWYGLTGLAGCLVTFLVFVSVHQATSPNVLLLWLNPLQLAAAVGVWSRKLKWMTLITIWYDIFVVGAMLIIWPFQLQSANLAFFPMMGATLVLSVAYALISGKIEETTMASRKKPARRKTTSNKRYKS